jgi:molybdopterin/thiamine biosynthesis adenylyltransferase
MIKSDIHIIGCGAVGSTVAEMLARMGIEKIHLYDFDTVSPHNIANQMFYAEDINDCKTNALSELCARINPNVKIIEHTQGWVPGTKLSGYVFLCVDNIDLRRQIIEENQNNPYIKAVMDYRMRLTDAQHYAADWSDPNSIKALLSTMQFSHDEAKEATPTNACGTTMNIIPTVRVIVSLGLANFINFVKTGNLKKMILADAFSFMLDAF